MIPTKGKGVGGKVQVLCWTSTERSPIEKTALYSFSDKKADSTHD